MTKVKPELKEVDFENSLNQLIKPGDRVIVVTSGYNHRVNIKPGVYLGKKNDGVSCRVNEYHTHYRHKETGEEVGFYWWDHADKLLGKLEYPKYERTTAKYGTPEYEEYAKESQRKGEEYRTKWRARQEMYEPFKVPYHRHTTLQLNRIYKIDTPAVDIKI